MLQLPAGSRRAVYARTRAMHGQTKQSVAYNAAPTNKRRQHYTHHPTTPPPLPSLHIHTGKQMSATAPNPMYSSGDGEDIKIAISDFPKSLHHILEEVDREFGEPLALSLCYRVVALRLRLRPAAGTRGFLLSSARCAGLFLGSSCARRR